jgi:DNA-directed RNA polymerase specialized sigma24 family protein
MDDLLQAFLQAPSEEEADRQLARLLDEVAKPVVRRIVESLAREDAEDLLGDTILDLLRRLRELRAQLAPPIRDLRGYIATCAYNACHERMRERYPARARLRNQVQYLCGHHAKLAVWRNANGAIVCGLTEWEGRDPIAEANVSLPARSDPAAENRAQLLTLVPAIFKAAGAPLALDTLVDTIARLIHLELQRVDAPLSNEITSETAADTALELRVSLRQLWEDVQQLAPKQRAALLLNLRDVHGRECLSLLPLTRTATIPEIAKAVEMPLERFQALWKNLPLSDVAIGELLDASGRQVIKMRRLARERLRRMEKSRGQRNTSAELDSSRADMVLVTRNRR